MEGARVIGSGGAGGRGGRPPPARSQCQKATL